MIELHPFQSIVPIFKVEKAGENAASATDLLGTGFAIGSPPHIITAAHVFRNAPLEPDTAYCVMLNPNRPGTRLWRIANIRFGDDVDIASFSVPEGCEVDTLPVKRSGIPCNEDVCSFDFSHTLIKRIGDKKRSINFAVRCHKGNILRYFDSDFPEARVTHCLEVSFPAFQGASGAPVIRLFDGTVVGMLVANSEHHLIPSQICRIDHGETDREETSYFLPLGKGLGPREIVEFVKDIPGVVYVD